MSTFSPLDHMKVKYLISINQYTFYIDVSHLWLLCEMITKNCANGPQLVLKDLYEKSFVRNDRLPLISNANNKVQHSNHLDTIMLNKFTDNGNINRFFSFCGLYIITKHDSEGNIYNIFHYIYVSSYLEA